MRYQEYKPSQMLAPWIECYWFFEGRYLAESWETIVADGFPELIFHLGAPFAERLPNGDIHRQPRAVVAGQLTKPLELRSLGEVKIAAIRFRPAGISAFAELPMRLLTDTRVDAGELFAGVEELSDALQDSANDLEGVRACERFLLDSLNSAMVSPAVSHAIQLIGQTGGDIRVESVAEQANLGRRSLELAFRDQVGVTPKQFCRVIRFRRAFDLLTEGESREASKIAIDAGFFDQSHLIRDFRQFAGEPPAGFFLRESPLAHALAAN